MNHALLQNENRLEKDNFPKQLTKTESAFNTETLSAGNLTAGC